MPTDVFLFPNALLSSEEALSLGSVAIDSTLKEMLGAYKNPSAFRIFDNQQLSGYATTQYEWMLLTGRSNLAPYAPFLWKGLGGCKIDKEIWSLNPYKIVNNRCLETENGLDLDEECLLVDFLNPIVRTYGFEVQTLNGAFFLARKSSWDLVTCPWPAQRGKHPATAEGDEANSWQSLMDTISQGLKSAEICNYRKEHQKDPIDGLWISGGGFDKPLTPCSQLRCVLTSDPFLIGLSEDSGIPRYFIRSLSKNWPNCPEGDRLVAFDDFKPYKKDNQLWTEHWERTLDRIKSLLNSSVGMPATKIRFVATDGLFASSIELEKSNRKSLLARLRSAKDNPQNAQNWLSPQRN